MKHSSAILFSLLLLGLAAVAPVSDNKEFSTESAIAYAHAVSEGAEIGPDRLTPECADHYGDPTRFTQYIIAVPVTRA